LDYDGLRLSIAATAVMAYLIADIDERLPSYNISYPTNIKVKSH